MRTGKRFPIPGAARRFTPTGTVFTISWAQARCWPVPGSIIIPHSPPNPRSCVFGEGMTVHGGAQLHDVIGQGRHSSASFWRPLTGDDIAMTRPKWVPFITAASSKGACYIVLCCRSLPGAAKGPCRRASHLAAKCHRPIPKT